MSIYKPCDIRGAVTELSTALYMRWGLSLGRMLESGAVFVVGGDVRLSTPAFKAAFIRGLCEAGMAVCDLGIVPTPMVYFAKRHLSAAACAIITASHNPPRINGLKWMIHDLPANEESVAALQRDVESSEFPHTIRQPGSVQVRDISAAYQRWLQTMFPISGQAAGQVILDPGNGCWSIRAKRYLQALFPGVRFTAIHDSEDGSFPLRNPDSSRPEYLLQLSEEVRRQGADLGIAFDGDGDRVAFVDGEGRGLLAEEATWVLLHSLAEQWPGRAFVYDIKFSDHLRRGAEHLAALPCMERSGHAFIRRRMLAEQALFGAEISGHYFYDVLDGGDDGLYSAALVLAYLARSGQSLATLRQACPVIYMTPELRVGCTAQEQQQAIDTARTAFQQYQQSYVDGVRITFPNGWALMRSSVTESALTFRFEADSASSLTQLVTEYCGHLAGIGETLYRKYQQAMPKAESPARA